jgi:hypothetical protein
MRHDPEFASVEAFAAFLRDEERDSFSVEELHSLNFCTHRPMAELTKELERLGFSLVRRSSVRRVRGFRSSSHDRWFGAGSEKTHGGSGF